MRAASILCFLAVCALLATAHADTCGGNCPSDDCETGVCPCGDDSNYQDIPTMCAQFSGWVQSECECIMNAESSGNANAMNYNSDNTYDVGLWQVNSYNWDSCSNGNAPCDVPDNLNCAIDVWQWGGSTFSLWSTCSGCGCCDGVSSVNPEWDGTFPKGYDNTRAFPKEFAHVNRTAKF